MRLADGQKLEHQWIRSEILLAASRGVTVRLTKACGLKEAEMLQQIGGRFTVRELPKTEAKVSKHPPPELGTGLSSLWASPRIRGRSAY